MRIIGAAPATELGIPKAQRPRPRTVTASAESVTAVLADVPPWARWCILLAWDCGLRAMTCIELRPRDIVEGRIQTRTKRGHGTNLPLTPRLAQFHAAACAMMQPDKSITEILGCKGNKQQRYGKLQDLVRNTQIRLNLHSRWTMHDLRRSAAHDLYNRTRDLRKVQALLCHTDLAHTAWYLDSALANLSAEDMRPAERESSQTPPLQNRSGEESSIQ